MLFLGQSGIRSLGQTLSAMSNQSPQPHHCVLLCRYNGASIPSTGTKSSVSTTLRTSAIHDANASFGMNCVTGLPLPARRFALVTSTAVIGFIDAATMNVYRSSLSHLESSRMTYTCGNTPWSVCTTDRRNRPECILSTTLIAYTPSSESSPRTISLNSSVVR